MAQVTKAPDLRLSVVATLPPEVTVRLLSEIDVISRRMTRQILSGISLPDSRFRTLGYFRTVTAACRDALRTFVRLLRDGRGLRAGDLERLGSMGAQQAELDVPLELVFGAYRLAARVLWDEVIGQPAVLNDVPPSTVIGLTSTVLEYFDEISAAVGGAYLETRERLLRQRDRDRDRILQRLVAGDATAELRRIAASAELTLLPPYTVVACSAPTIEAERQLEETWRAEGAHLIGEEPGLWIALVPEGRDLAKLCAEVGPVVFGVGPVAATLEAIAPSAQQARRALEVGRTLYPARMCTPMRRWACLPRSPMTARRCAPSSTECSARSPSARPTGGSSSSRRSRRSSTAGASGTRRIAWASIATRSCIAWAASASWASTPTTPSSATSCGWRFAALDSARRAETPPARRQYGRLIHRRKRSFLLIDPH